jgi:hypothetical protein
MSKEGDENKTVQLRIRKSTAQQLRYLYAISGDKMIDIIERLVRDEYEKSQEEQGES